MIVPCGAAEAEAGSRISVNSSHMINQLAVSADGRFVATGGYDNTVKLWDIASGSLLRTMVGNTAMIDGIAFSPDGSEIASTGRDQKVRFWSTETGELKRTFANGNAIGHISFSGDGSAVFVPQFRIDARTGALTKYDSDMATNNMAVSPDGRWAAVGQVSFDDPCRIVLWDLSSGRIAKSWRAHSASIFGVQFSADGKRLFTSGDRTVKVWDMPSGKLLKTFAGHDTDIASMAISADGRWIASSDNGKLRLWDLSAGDQPQRTTEYAFRGTRQLSFSPDSRQLLAGGYFEVQVISVETGEVTKTLSGAGGATFGARGLSTQDGWIAATPAGLATWSLQTGKLGLARFELDRGSWLWPGNPQAVKLDNKVDTLVALTDGGQTAILSHGRSLSKFDRRAGKIVGNFSVGPEQNDVVFKVGTSQDGSLLATTGLKLDGIKIWDGSGKLLRTFGALKPSKDCPEPRYQALAVHPTGKSLVVSGPCIKGFSALDAETGKVKQSIGAEFAYLLRYSPDGRYLFADIGYRMDEKAPTLGMYNADTLTLHKTFAAGNYLQEAALSPDQRLLATTGGIDKQIRLFATDTGAQVRELKGSLGTPQSLAFSPDSRRVRAFNDNGTSSEWDPTTGELLVNSILSDTGEWATITPEGFFVASDGGARFLFVVRGKEVLGIDRFYQTLYRPDLVAEKLAGDPRGLVKEAAAKLDLDKVMASGSPPSVAITAPAAATAAETDEVKVEADLTDTGGGIGRIEWKVNGVTQGNVGQRGLERVEAPAAKTSKISQVLSLEPGDNVIELVVYNSANLIASQPAKISISMAETAAKPPRLFVLALGINDYYDSRLRLTYAVPDATQIGQSLQQAGTSHYESVDIVTLTDAHVTADSIAKAFADLSKKVRAKDVLVFFAAGHGKTVDGRYYYLPQDFRYQTEASIAEHGIGQDKWQVWFASIAARKSILIYDTCESGSLTAGEQIAMRSGLEQQAAVGRLIQATGRTVLTASTSDRPALEGYKGHGVFTYALLDGLVRGDRNANGLIEVTELAGYVDTVVPEITQKAFGLRQLPQMNISGSDFPLVRKLDAVAEGPAAAMLSTASEIPSKPTHVVFELVKVFKAAGGSGEVVMELAPATTFAVVKTEDGWSIIARDGKVLGYVEEAKAQKLQ